MAKKYKKKKNKTLRGLKRILILVIVFIIFSIVSLFVAPTEEEFQAKQESSSFQTVEITNLELPQRVEGEQLIEHTDYVLSYNEKYEQPSYVAYELDSNEIYGPSERKNNFKADPSVTTGSASLNDYKKSGYDRGHLCPAADQKESDKAMSDSFYMSNMSPQEPDFNRGIWADLEGTVRTFADTNGLIYIVTGPVLTDGPYKTIGDNKVAVPKNYYKVILDYTNPEIKAIGFILPNKGSQKNLKSFATSVNEVEEVTGLDFFINLPDNQEEEIEGSFNTEDWLFKEFLASSGNGSFDENMQESETVTIPLEKKGFAAILQEGSLYIMVKLRVEVINVLNQFVSKDVLTTIGIS